MIMKEELQIFLSCECLVQGRW